MCRSWSRVNRLDAAPPTRSRTAYLWQRLGAARRTIGGWINHFDWLIYPTFAFLLSRALIFAGGTVADLFLATEEGHWVADPNSPFLSMWAKWDSQWYIQIARDGYWFQPLQQSNVAFFPLYPLLVRWLAPMLGDNLILAGFVVSNACFFVALIFVYKLAAFELAVGDASSVDNGRDGARRSLFYLAFFPTSFFFSAIYTESLFLLLSVSTMYFARRRRWALAASAGLLAAATRNLGVVLWGLVMWEWLRSHGWRVTRIHRREAWRNLWEGIKHDWGTLFLVAAIPLGLILYMAFLKQAFDRPMAFVEVQAAWNRQNIGPVAVVLRELRAIADWELTRSNISRLLNLSAFLCVLGISPFIWRRLGEGYALYVLILLLVPASSALQSMIRYLLPMFPLFILLGAWGRNGWLDRTLIVTFTLFLGVLTAIFVNWIFIA